VEADALCSELYPDAVYLGTSFQTPVQGSGTPAEILAWLPGGRPDGGPAAVLHLGCHARTGKSADQSRLILARKECRPEELPAGRILAQAQSRGAGMPGGLVVLGACLSDLSETDHDEALTLASAFLAAGSKCVVGSRWEVNDLHTALLMFMLHRHLVRHPGDSTADALRAAQLWMLDRQRRAPPEMPEPLASQAGRPELADMTAWAAFTHTGC
jgi:CHAT domain-containing protein